MNMLIKWLAMFIGRKNELAFLEDCYKKAGFDFVPIYGRRRVGKTELIHEFVKDKKAILYAATEQAADLSLAQFSKAVAAFFEMSYLSTFEDWDQLFEFIGHQTYEGKLVIVIDEYPYLAEQYQPLSSILQKHMDHTFKERDILFILCGSSMSFMENQVLGYKSPLYGRRTGQIKLMPMDYLDAGEFLPEGSAEEKFLLYSVGGGIPYYLKQLTAYDSLEKGIIECFFKPMGHLYEEPYNLLKQELREPANYFSIITAIAAGKSKSNEIATTAGISNTSLTRYINALIDLGIIARVLPVGQQKKRGIYRIQDNCFRFWFRFVLTNKATIEFSDGAEVWKDIRQEALPTFQGQVFEAAAITYLYKKRPFKELLTREMGSWWGNNAAERRQEEIDILGDCGNGAYIIGECKWRNEAVRKEILMDLKRKAGLLTFASERYFCLFSKSSFSKELTDEDKKDSRLKLVTLEDMYA